MFGGRKTCRRVGRKTRVRGGRKTRVRGRRGGDWFGLLGNDLDYW